MEISVTLRSVHLVTLNVFNIFLLWLLGAFIVFIGAWGSLQFKFVRQRFLNGCVLIERAVFSFFPFFANVILGWAAIGLTGHVAPFYMLAIMLTTYVAMVLPLRSSFLPDAAPGAESSLEAGEQLIVGKRASGFHAVAMCVVPPVVYAAMHRRVFASDIYGHTANVVLLVIIPRLALLALRRRGSLWWWEGAPGTVAPRDWTTLQKFALVFGTCVAIGVVEYRIVYRSLARYLFLRGTIAWVAVTMALYGTVGAVLIATLDSMRGEKMVEAARGFRSPRMMAMLVLANVGAVGWCGLFPWYMWLAPILAMSALVTYHEKRSLLSYCVAVAGAEAALLWFLFANLRAVDFTLSAFHLTATPLSIAIASVAGLSLFLPGLAISQGMQFHAVGPIIVIHAVVLAVLEAALYYGEAGSVPGALYPGYCVLATSAMGGALANRLWGSDAQQGYSAPLALAVHAAKLTLLTGYGAVVFPATLAVLIPTTVLAVETLRAMRARTTGAVRRDTMTERAGIALFACIGIGCLVSQNYVLPPILRVLLPQYKPAGLGATGLAALLWGVASSPLSLVHFPESAFARYSNLELVAFGGLLALLEPTPNVRSVVVSLVRALTSLPNALHLAHTDPDQPWIEWALLVGCVVLVAGFLGGLSRPSAGVFAGYALGLGMAGLALPPHPALLLIVGASAAGMALVIAFLVFPTVKSPKFLHHVYFTVSGLVVPSMLLSRLLFSHIPRSLGQEPTEVSQLSFLVLHAGFNTAVALIVKFQWQPPPGAAKGEKTVRVFDWVPSIGNLGAFFGFLEALVVSLVFFQGKTLSVLFLTPMLLLLNNDGWLVSGLSDTNRYFPLMASLTLFSSLEVIRESALLPLMYALGSDVPTPHASSLRLALDIILLAAAGPAQYYFLCNMWDGQTQTRRVWTLIGPPNLAVVALGSLYPLKVLGAVGLSAGALQYYTAHERKRESMRVI